MPLDAGEREDTLVLRRLEKLRDSDSSKRCNIEDIDRMFLDRRRQDQFVADLDGQESKPAAGFRVGDAGFEGLHRRVHRVE